MNNRHSLLSMRIKELRIERGITQKQLAMATNLSYSSIIDYENRRREPNSKAMATLERFFQVTGEYLRGDTDNNGVAAPLCEDGLLHDYQFIGVDINIPEDFSAVSCICGQCKTVIASRTYNPEINEVEVPFFIKCPKCGIRFKKHIYREDIKKSVD